MSGGKGGYCGEQREGLYLLSMKYTNIYKRHRPVESDDVITEKNL